MRFWDSSALVPLVREERRSVGCRRLLRSDAEIVVWVLTRTEMVSAVWQRSRARELSRDETRSALGRIDRLAARWTEVDAVDAVRDRAERLVALHALHAADALQLAAGLVFADDRPRGRLFVTLDDALVRAADAEGFKVIEPQE